PIVDKEIEGTMVGIYNEQTQRKHPLLGLRLKNTTGLHLMQGPITVYTDGTYAGDARIQDLQPGEERLISFALDLGTEVQPQVVKPAETLVTVRIDKGILYATTKVRTAKTYVARNRSPHDRILLIEHPFRPEFTLVSPEFPGWYQGVWQGRAQEPPQKPYELTREVYRFKVQVPAGKTVSLDVVEERTVVQEVTLTNADDQTILRYVSGTAASGALKDALAKAKDLKRQLEATRREIAHVERQLKAILDDQARL